jgi:tetratricopeptide (TPR) repeat protein
MQQWAGKATADSGVSRNLADDGAFISASEAEVALAEGRSARALERIEPAHIYLKEPETLSTLAAAYAATGRVEDAIARYEELLKDRPFGYEGQQLWFDAHLALGRLYEQEHRPQDALRTYESLINRWKDADADLILLTDARARLSRLH